MLDNNDIKKLIEAQKEVLKIHNEALKRSKILTDEEAAQISKSSVF